MPDITATELRRLEALAERVTRVEERRKSMMDQRDEAREEAKAHRATIRELTTSARRESATAEELQGRLDELVKLNAEQADRLADAERTSAQAIEAAAKLADIREHLEVRLEADRTSLDQATKTVAQLTKSGATLKQQVQVLEAQVAEEEQPVFLPADKVGDLLDDFINKFDPRGLKITEGDVRLSVAFASAGSGAAFVIPSTAAQRSDLPLHTVNLRLGPRADVDRQPADGA